MSSLPTRRLRQRKSLPPRLGPTTRLSQSLNTANTNVNSPNSNLSPVKGEQVTTRKRESLPEKEQLPSNVQFMFNSLPSKNFPSSRLSDSSLNFHGDKFRRFGENVDHIYGVLKSSRRTQQPFDSISKTSPKKVKGRHLDAFRQDEIDNENKVFGDYPVGLLNHNEVIFPYNAKTQHGNMSSKQMNDKRKFLGLQVENRTKSEILLNTHDCKNNVGKKSSLVSPMAYDSDFSAKDCIPDRRQNRVNCLSVQNIKTEMEEEDSSDSDYEVTCNMQRVRSRLSSSRRTSGYNMEDYTDSSSYTSSEQSTPERKRKRHSSEFSDTDYVPKKSRPVRKNAQIVPVPSPVRTQKLLLEVNEKLQQHMKSKESLKTTDVKEEREDIEMETRGGVNMKFAQGSECDATEVKKKKDGRGRPRLPENRDKIYKPEVKKQRKPGSGRPRKYPIDPGSTRPRKFPTNPGSGNTKKYPGGPEKMFTQAKNRFTVLASQAKAPVVHDEPVRVDAKYNFAPNDEVLARWNDGILYYGHIIKVDEAERKCYVKFDDNSKFWIMFKDLQKGAPDDDDDELCMCSVCNGGESEVPNEIVLCDSCGLEPQVEPEKQVTPLGNNVVRETMKKTEEQFSEVNMCMGKNLLRKSPRRVRKSKQSEIFQYYGDTTDSMSGLEEDIWASNSFKDDCAKTRKSNRKCRRKVDDSYLFDDEVEGFLTQDEAWGKYMDKSPLFKTVESFDIKWNRADEKEGINIVKVEEPSSTDEGPNQDVPPTKYKSGNNPSGRSLLNTESDLKIKFVKLRDRDNAYTVVDMSCKPACFPPPDVEVKQEVVEEEVEEKELIETEEVGSKEEDKSMEEEELEDKELEKSVKEETVELNEQEKSEHVTEDDSDSSCVRVIDDSSRRKSYQGVKRSSGCKSGGYQCPQCNQVFSELYRLKRHVLSHTAIRPYKCLYFGCSWSFKRKEHLDRHMIKVHKDCTDSTDSIITKDKRDLDDFVETLCVDSRKTVSRQGSLGQGFFSCSLCQESFDTLTKYRTHNYEHLKRNYVLGLHLCTMCSMGFKDKKNLIRHRRRGSCEPFHPSQDSDTSDCEPDFTKNISHRFKHNSNATQPDIAEVREDEIFECPYHQQCHTPNIGEDVLKPDVEWKCRLCVFAAAVKEGGAVKTGPTAEALQRMKQVLPYDIDRLTWDAQHRVNVERTYCYCGGPGLWSRKMLQCCRCRQWFHEACIQCLDHPLMTGDKFYVFVCSHCNAGPEYIKRLEMTWSDVIHLALYCMSSQCGLPKKLYEEEEIIEFINSHWEQLQLKQFSEVTPEDRKAKILEELSSPCNRRFSNGQELGKPATLWSLRQRLPPPAPTIMLPFEGKVTEAVMQTLQLIGKGRVKYLVPKDSPILTDLIKTEKPDGGIKDKVKETAESAPAVRPSSGFPLDRLIPFPDNFTGYNHPFKTEVEQREERHFEFRKMQIMNYLCLNSDGDCLSQHSTASCSTDDPTKAIPTPPPSLSGGHISDLPYPTKPSDIKDSRKRKAPEDNPPSSLRQSKRKRVSVSGRYGIDPDIMDFQSLDDLRSLDEYSEKFKMGVNNYNSTSDRLKKGEKYKVLGKRISPDGKVHYLVQWEGLITKDK